MALDLDALKKRRARRTSSGWTAKEGDNQIRVLPHTSRYFTEQLNDFALEFRSHFLRADGMDTAVYRCLRDQKQPCAICEVHKRFKESDNANLKQLADQLRASERHLMNIVDLNDPGVGIQLYETGPQVYDAILEFVSNPNWGDVVNPENGKNITVTLTPGSKSRSGFNSYSVLPNPNSTSIVPHLPADWQTKLDEIESGVPAFPTPSEIQKWLEVLGVADGHPTSAGNPSTAAAPVASAPAAPAAPPEVPAIPAAAPVPVASAIPVAPVAEAAVTPATIAAATPAATGPADVPVALRAFVEEHKLGWAIKKDKPLPACYSEGPNRPDIGFDPRKFPCDPCPVKADCQLTKLGLA